MRVRNKFSGLVLSLLLVGCAATSTPVKTTTETPQKLNIVAGRFSDLPGWSQENFQGLAQAYNRSCNRVLKKSSQGLFGVSAEFGTAQEWQIACRKFAKINQGDAQAVRQFFEQNFAPYSARSYNNPEGLFTGYYEASLRGSRTKQGVYQYPLRARPDDLVMVDLGAFRDELKGQRIAGRVQGGRLKPYETHADINAGKMPAAQDKTLVWVDSPVDAFFLQIQGSGVVALDDGAVMRVGYAGQNGHPYYAIGKELIKRGALTKGNVSMQSIRDWLQNNPAHAQALMETNKSYVFFSETKGAGPKGGEGIALTPQRSLAIDRSLIPYGMPVWLSAQSPKEDKVMMNRLMVTQDTGGAIRGPVRGDFFWGYGAAAEEMAGAMKSKGRYWFLIPKTL